MTTKDRSEINRAITRMDAISNNAASELVLIPREDLLDYIEELLDANRAPREGWETAFQNNAQNREEAEADAKEGAA